MSYHLAGSCDRAMTIPATDGSTQINDAPLTSANNSAMRQRSDTTSPLRKQDHASRPVQGAQGSTVSIDEELVVISPCARRDDDLNVSVELVKMVDRAMAVADAETIGG